MRRASWLAAIAALCLGPVGVWAQEAAPEGAREARIWLDRGDEPVVQRGERVRVYYRTSHDSYVAVFQIDTDGSVRLVHPAEPEEDHYVQGGRDYRLLFPRSPYWNVDEDPGVGYYFLVASPEPFDFSAFEYARYDRGWDLSRVGRAVYEDPYVAMDDYVAALIPDWEVIPYSLDFLTYNVGGTHDYPRFMCYQCHGFRSYADWNPYLYACTDFRVVIWDDPYYYPAFRYRGTRVVYATPLRARPRFAFTTRLAGQPWAPVVRRRAAPPTRTAEYKEPPTPRTAVTPPVRRRATPSDALRPGGAGSRAPVAAPSTQRRAAPSRSLAAPSRRSPSGSTAQPSTSGLPTLSGTAGPRPVLQRRPGSATSRSGGSTVTGPGSVTRPSSGSSRVSPSRGQSRPAPVTRSRPSTSRPSTARAPTVRSRPSSGSRPTVRAPSRPPSQARPAVRPRSGGSSTARPRPPVRRRGGGGF